MASLSDDDRQIIKDHPLSDFLDHLRPSLESVERSYSVAGSLDGVDDRLAQHCQNVVSRLLSTLQGEEAASMLRSSISKRDVASELFNLLKRVRKDDFSYQDYRPLVKLIIQRVSQRVSDYDIWSAVLDLIAKLSRVTPVSTNLPPAFDNTPITQTSASTQDSEQTRLLVEARVFEEIRGCTYRNVSGFFEKYFEGRDWTDRSREVYESAKNRHVDGRWIGLGDLPSPYEVQDWLFQLQDDLLSKERRRYYTVNDARDLVHDETRRQIDLVVKRKGGSQPAADHDLKDIEVIGELTASDERVKEPLVQLAWYARDVFSVQPTRRYLHAFTICGSLMTTWVFDRSGCYSQCRFNIHKEPERFIRVIAGYTMMDEDELGLDTFMERDGDRRRFIHVEHEGRPRKLQLEPHPLIRQRAIVCRGTSCYLAKDPDSEDYDHVAKFSWVSARRRPEAELFKLAKERNVKGIAELVGYCDITSISELRSGMTFSEPYSFGGLSSTASSLSESQSSPSRPHRHRPPSGVGRLSIAESTGGRPLRKRKSTESATKPSKRPKSSSQRSNSSRNEVTADVEETKETSLFASSDGPYDNRRFCCLVISPAGRPIYKYAEPLELLEALRDAIKAHKSLYMDGKILHRDISENNIIITDPKKTGFAGMLIDMDFARELSRGRSGARCRTGTLEFMAIEVLLNIDHTYRHDLESFFYVLLWQCGRRGWEFVCDTKDQPIPSLLTSWYTGSYDRIANIKLGSVDAKGFERILAKEFPPEFDCIKPLCRELRGILFPIRDNAIFTGTPRDPEVLYGPFIKAFDKAIDSQRYMDS
ncbi:hypothetical protein VTO42DRAFT_4273 [Malbranchea cinnamomea]